MRIVLLGHSGIEAAKVGRVLDYLTRGDTVVVTGALSGLAKLLLKRRPVSQRATLEVQLLEPNRYPGDEATIQLAAQLVSFHRPHAIVLVGEPQPLLQEQVMRLAEAEVRPVPVVTGEDFVRERSMA